MGITCGISGDLFISVKQTSLLAQVRLEWMMVCEMLMWLTG